MKTFSSPVLTAIAVVGAKGSLASIRVQNKELTDYWPGHMNHTIIWPIDRSPTSCPLPPSFRLRHTRAWTGAC